MDGISWDQLLTNVKRHYDRCPRPTYVKQQKDK